MNLRASTIVRYMISVFMICAGGIAFCNDQVPQYSLGPIDQIVLEACIEMYGVSFLQRKCDWQEIAEILIETEIARNDTSKMGKAVLKKLHTIKHKSRYETLKIDRYSDIYASFTYSGSLKDADPLILKTCFTDMPLLRAALQQCAKKI